MIINCILKHFNDKTCLGDAHNIFNNIGDDKELFKQVEYISYYSEKYKYLKSSEIALHMFTQNVLFMVPGTYFSYH